MGTGSIFGRRVVRQEAAAFSVLRFSLEGRDRGSAQGGSVCSIAERFNDPEYKTRVLSARKVDLVGVKRSCSRSVTRLLIRFSCVR